MKSIFKIYGCCKTIIVTPSEYSDGAAKVNFPIQYSTKGRPIVYVDARIKDSIGLVALPSITNRLRDEYERAFGNPDVRIHLILTYMPHARQDRYTGDNAFTFKYSALPLIKAANVDIVSTEDPHSNVCIDLLVAEGIPVEVHSQHQALVATGNLKSLIEDNYQYVVAPDKGAADRAKEMVRLLGLPLTNIIQLNKSRDPDTGRISFEPYESVAYLQPTKVIMFDDIGDGCWTHILAAEALKANGVTKHVTLVLTHGVFSKGIDHLHPAIDHLIVLNDWREATKDCLVVDSHHTY